MIKYARPRRHDLVLGLTLSLISASCCAGIAVEPDVKAKSDFTNTIGMQFINVQAGRFAVGAHESDKSAIPAEKPQHNVTLTSEFYLGTFEVTQAEYERVMGENPSKFKFADHPVENVSWQNAVRFCDRLSSLKAERAAGNAYHLPTEAEWEYACRAGSTSLYYFGDDATKLGEFAWHKDNSESKTHPVGKKRANAWGFYDMHGNVREWVRETVYSFGRFEEGRTIENGALSPFIYEPNNRVLYRSGSWAADRRRARSSFRMMSSTGSRGFGDHNEGRHGFRVLLQRGDVSKPSAPTKTIKTALRAAPKPTIAFILAGQSNMEGQGVVEMDHPIFYNGGKGNLVWSMKNSKSAKMMRHLRDKNGEWVVRDDVSISFKDKRETRTGKLSIGYTGYGGKSHIGPELQFGHVVGDLYDQPVLLIKTAWGGKSLNKDFRPPSAGGTVGPYYEMMVAEVRAALAHHQKLTGQQVELAGFVWMQGWNDLFDESARNSYADNLGHLASDVRREFDTPRLPFVVGELGNGGPKAAANMLALRQAQKVGTEQIENAVFVPTTDFARPADMSPNVGHGHHWFGNAESYFLVGNALGHATVKLSK